MRQPATKEIFMIKIQVKTPGWSVRYCSLTPSDAEVKGFALPFGRKPE
jgi:hypothetical protein